MMDIVLCSTREQALWDNYVQWSSTATACHLFAWRTIIERAYGHQALYLMARKEGTVAGILPLILVKSPLLGTSLTSMPFLDYGGLCADDQTIADLLLDNVLRIKQESGAQWVELRQCEPLKQANVSRVDKVSMLLDLSGGEEFVWKSLSAKVRNQVRKSEKSGLTTCVGGVELLNDFYDVFAVNMRDLGSPVHGKSFFTHMCVTFKSQMRVMLARDEKKTVGGLICLFFKNAMLVPWASSLKKYFTKCPNNLLYWRAIQYGCQHGYKEFDFGRSSIGSGTYDFKRQWGAKAKPLYWHILSPIEGKGGIVSAANMKYRAAQAVWKHLPLTVTRVIGPRIRRYLTN